jgi:glycosyltransferase involved in cell wall biosynthesis
MKILTVTNYYPPYFIGGYEIACKDTMDFLINKGHDITVLTSDYGSSNNQTHIKREMRLINYQKSSRFERIIDEHYNYKQIKKALKKYKPDLVYFWSLRGIGLGVIEAVEHTNITKVFEIGDFWMQGYLDHLDPNSWRQKLKAFIPFSHTKPVKIEPAICVSKWVEKEMQARYHTTQSYTIYNGTQIPPKPIFQDSYTLRFIFAGRLDEEKGLDLAIEALKLFAENYPNIDFEFNIYGDGDKNYIHRCKVLAQPIKEKINFRGKVNHKEEIYTNGSIFLMPTRMREPFGLVVIEAMVHGCVVIATNAYGPKEIIEHKRNGLLFEPENVEDLYHQIETLHKDKTLFKKLYHQGYADVKQNFAIEVVKPKVEEILKKIVGVNS